ncbi:hypothetical protein CERZMDRAFT_92618 [Cercospora zeae-maydis SCOH1-5]|uniref:Uncharacterized protein n=1 Tax=Cercospora zeae-maydis SCOH1-5 TaxID=717836 RepID=A0A6A6FXT2_9PEZI|nr:hypothetical protein CERZMDRAFT_92618 [Cercospora zeae-maydis SCOH1-5]
MLRRWNFTSILPFLADKYNVRGLHKLATNAFQSLLPETGTLLAAAAKVAYTAPAATKEICQAISAEIAKRPELLKNEEGEMLVQFMEENGSFALTVARKIAATRQALASETPKVAGKHTGMPRLQSPSRISWDACAG